MRVGLAPLPAVLPPFFPLGAVGRGAVGGMLHPIVVVEPDPAAWRVLVRTPAAHPVGASVRQVVVVRFGVPAA